MYIIGGLSYLFKMPSFNNTITTLTSYKNYGKKILLEKTINIIPKNTTYYNDSKKFLYALRAIYYHRM